MIKDILLHVDPSPAGAHRAEVACRLASRFDAHLSGLYVNAVDEEVLFYYAEMVASAIAALKEQAVLDNRRAQEIFFRATEGANFSYEWRSVKGAVATAIAAQGRCVDLVVLGQGTGAAARHVCDRVPMLIGRPVLIVPNQESPGASTAQRIAIAWDGGREATRAVHDALPLLKTAEAVSIVTVLPESQGESVNHGSPATDLATHLDRHGVRTHIIERPRAGLPIAEVLQGAIAEVSADLLVMGFYGHSRMSELVLGGVTRDILNTSNIAVFGAH